MTREVARIFARKVAHIAFIILMLGCGLAISTMSSSDQQATSNPCIIDVFDSSTGVIHTERKC